MEKQGWLAPNNEILRVKDDESHQSKAREITKKIGVKISQDKDIRLELINIGYVFVL